MQAILVSFVNTTEKANLDGLAVFACACSEVQKQLFLLVWQLTCCNTFMSHYIYNSKIVTRVALCVYVPFLHCSTLLIVFGFFFN